VTNIERRRVRIKRLRAAGICPVCGLEPTPIGSSCETCRSYGKAYQEAKRRLLGLPVKARGVCSRNRCRKPHKARGFCDTHYRQALKEAKKATFCECGAPRTAEKPTNKKAWACERCSFLDSREGRMDLGFTWGGQP
jgi:hypothetical protein